MINATVEKTYLPSKNSKTELLSLRTNYYRKKRVWTSLNRTFYNIPTQRVSIHQDVKTGRPIKQMKPLTANEGINNNCSSRLIMKEAGVLRNGRNFAKALLCRCCQRKCAPPDFNDTSPHSVLSSDEAGRDVDRLDVSLNTCGSLEHPYYRGVVCRTGWFLTHSGGWWRRALPATM